ncbi:MAG: T9SS type A sorting domain-containing protein, partial [Bacteroidales bacterium]|nr:T9SS type A sorting domain-containing protein [Bacteroidales bacterium]
TSYTIEDASGEGTLRTPHVNAGLDYFGTPIPSTERDIIAVINQFNETMQVMPRSLADFIAVGSFDVTFVVKDESDVPIDDAVITFDGETMDPGHYVFEDVAIGTYSYSVARAGYNTVTGSMLIEEDIEILIIMVKPDEENMITDFPWTEDFDGDEFPPAGWKKYSFGDTGDWGLVDGWAHHTFTPEGEEADSWLVTTQIQLPEENVMLLSFLERNQFMDDYGYSGVLVSNGSGNPEHGHFVELYESSQPITGSKETMVSLADYAGELIYIAFVYQGEYAHRWWVDNIMIDFAPEAIEVPDIATLKEQTISPDLVYRITGEVVITVLQRAYRNQFYVQDASGAILIDDAPIVVETEYDLYDGITGLTGKLGAFQDMLQVLPTEDPGEATSHNNVVDPLEITLADITSDHQGLLVLVRNVSFDLDASPADFTHNQSYYIFDDTGEGEIRTPNSAGLFDYFETPVPTTPKDIVGVLHQRFEVVRLQPRMLADFMEPSSVPHIDPANIVLYPNPASTHFYVESHERQIDSVRMFNLNGQLVAEQSVTNTGQVKMDVTGMKNGIYMVQIIMNNQVVVHKVHINK